MIIEKKLYQQIQKSMPIPCVDLIIVNEVGEILMAKRTNIPAQGQWWFPGGRVHYLETRLDAAARKLREECGLDGTQFTEIGTFDVFIEESEKGSHSHAITTVFVFRARADTNVVLDSQHFQAEWHLPSAWLNLELNPFIRHALAIYTKHKKTT